LGSPSSVHGEVARFRLGSATQQVTLSALVISIHCRRLTISIWITARGPQMAGVDPDFAVCSPLIAFEFFGGFVPSAVSVADRPEKTPVRTFSA
jgi:hypothetical protein